MESLTGLDGATLLTLTFSTILALYHGARAVWGVR